MNMAILPARPRWYVYQAASRGQFKAAAELKAAGIEHFLPTFQRHTIVRHTKAVRKSELMPLLHNYLFAKVDQTNGRMVAAMEACKHIAAIVKPPGADRPIPAGDKEVESLRELCAAGTFDQGKKRGHDNRFANGDRVRIVEGPLAGLVVSFRETADGSRQPRSGSVWVVIDRMFGAEMQTEIEHDWIRAA